ncbi:MAG: hypothetical protein J6B93_02205 [Clostridia bacterium]|nr:hypothetical protein [Clostridia bacterium]
MKKINQGKYELFTTKQDAIDKFIQMQGLCREEINGYQQIEFYCTAKGKISVTNPPSRHIEHTYSTSLYGEIVEQDGKTYVEYYTVYSRYNNILKIISLVMLITMCVFAIVFAVADLGKKAPYIIFVVCCALSVFQLINTLKEKKNAPRDSKIMVNELEKRVNAVNLWDK